jgi:hypothetical protein
MFHIADFATSITLVEAFSALITIITSILGYVLTKALLQFFKARSKAVKETAVLCVHGGRIRSDSKDSSCTVVIRNSLADLPTDLVYSMASYLDAKDVARLGCASHMLRESYWSSPQVWCALSVVKGFSMPPMSLLAREQYRVNFFYISDDCSRALLQGAIHGNLSSAQVLSRATRMLKGLLPHDSMSILNCILEAGEAALWSHSPDGDAAVDSFLQVLRENDAVMPWQILHFEDIRCTTQRLDRSIEKTLPKVLTALGDGANQHAMETDSQ